MCPNINNKEVVEQFNQIVQQLGGEPLTIEEFKSAELRGKRTGSNYAAMETAYRIWDYINGEAVSADKAITSFLLSLNPSEVLQAVNRINTRLPNSTAAEHSASTKISGILSDLFPELSVEYVTSLANGNVGEIDLGALKVLVDYVNGTADTLPHEYAHYYYAMFQNSALMKEGIRVFGSEEALVLAIGKRVVELDGEQRKWYQKFLDWIKSIFSKRLYREALLGAITDAFLERKDLGNRLDNVFGIRHQAGLNITIDEARLALSQMANNLVFNATDHTYHIRGKDTVLTSVSDKKIQLGYNSYDDTLEDADQRKQSNDARERGTMIHAMLEDAFNGVFNMKKYPNVSEQAAMKIFNQVQALLADYDFVSSEARMYDESIGVAGTTDLILRNKQTGEYVVLDYKTKLTKWNDKVTKPGKSSKFGGFLYANSRKFSSKSNQDTYDFQLSLYQKMLLKAGINITQRGIMPITYEVIERDGKWTISDINMSEIFGSGFNEETNEFQSIPINDKKHHVQWIEQSATVKRDVNARIYQDYSDFPNGEEDGKRFIEAMNNALDIIDRMRKKLNMRINVNTRKGRRSAVFNDSVQLSKLNELSEIDAMLSYLVYSLELLARMVTTLLNLSKEGENASWSLSKLYQYYQIADSYDVISDVMQFINANEDLLGQSDMTKLRNACIALQASVNTIKGYYDTIGKKLYLKAVSPGINTYRAMLIEREEDKYTKENPMREGETGKQFRERRQKYIDQWVASHKEFLDRESAKWLDAQTRLAYSCFETNALGQYFSSVYESTDPFVQAMVRKYDDAMEIVNHKMINMRTRLDRLLKAYYTKYGYNNLSDLRKAFDDFVDVTEDGKCWLVTETSSEYLAALEKFNYDMRLKQSMSAEERRRQRRAWLNENNPITDLEAFNEEFMQLVDNWLEENEANEEKRKIFHNMILNNLQNGIKDSWQKKMYDRNNPIPAPFCEYLLDVEADLDSKYRKISDKFKNKKYEKMMKLSENDPKRKLWEMFVEIAQNEGNAYNLPASLRLNGRLPSVIKSKFEEAVTHSIKSAAKLGIEDAFSIMSDEEGVERGLFVDVSGQRMYQIPMPYTGKSLTEERQSFNLPDIFLRYYEAANTYSVKSKLEEYVIYTLSILSRRLIYGESSSTGNNANSAYKASQNTKNLFDAWVKQVFYNQRTADYGAIMMPGVSFKIDIAMFLKKLTKFSSNKVMTLNMVSAINNILTGDSQSLEEAFAGRFIDLKSYKNAHKIFIKEISTMLADAYRVTPQSKLNKLCLWLHVFDGAESVTIRGIMSNNLGDYMHSLTTLGERWIQGKFVIAYFLKMQAKDKDGKVLGSMYDFIDFDEDGNLILTNDKVANFSPDILNKESLKLRKVLMSLNGNYDGKRAAVAVESNALGWFGLSLRRWILNFVARRVGKENYDDTLGTKVNGMYKTFFRYLYKDAMPILAQKLPQLIGLSGIQIKNAEKLQLTARRFGELKDWERANVIRTTVEFGLATLAFLIFACIGSGDDDDDDDSTFLKNLKYQAYRLYTDLTFLNPLSFIKIFRDPFPASRTIQDIWNIFQQLFDPTEEYPNSNHMIKNKLADKIVGFIPGGRQFYRLGNIDNEMTYFIKGR